MRTAAKSPLWLKALTLLAIVAGGFVLAVAAWEWRAWSGSPGYSDFENVCGECHGVDVPKSYAKSPGVWKKTVEAMLEKARSDVAPGESAAFEDTGKIVSLLQDIRSANGDILVRLRCSRCHFNKAINPYYALSAPAFKLLIYHHIRQYRFAIQTWEEELILAKLMKLHALYEGDLIEQRPKHPPLFQRSCGVCHSVSFLYKDMCLSPSLQGEWDLIVNRMQLKAPHLIGEESRSDLVRYCQYLCTTRSF